MKKIGLTGGIGSGKSTVSKVFKLFGIPIYNSDEISKKILLNNKIIQEKIIHVLGEGIIQNDKINTTKISEIIFQDKKKLDAINIILHSEVKKDFNHWLVKQKGSYVIKESAIIFESKIESTFDKIILVKSSENTRIKRIMERDNKNKNLILSIIKNQYSNTFLSKKADYIINNDSNDLLIPQIIKLHEKIKCL